MISNDRLLKKKDHKVNSEFIEKQMSHMENLILKNQRQLHNVLPVPQLGSKFTKLANRFACKTNQSVHQNLLPREDPLINKVFTFKKQKKENFHVQNKKCHFETSFEETQLEYFRMINRQQKEEILKLKEDLKIINQRMNKTIEERKKSDKKLSMFYRTTNRSERKVSKVMEMAHQLIEMIRAKIILAKVEQNSNNRQQEMNWQTEKRVEHCSHVEYEQLKEQVGQKRTLDNTIKKTIDWMLMQEKKVQKQNSGTSNGLDLNARQENNHDDSMQESLDRFEKEVRELGVLQTLLKQVSRSFDTQVHKRIPSNHGTSQYAQDRSEEQSFSQIGSFFGSLLETKQMELHSSSRLQSLVVSQCIKPMSTRVKLYNSIRQIFEHQIFLLENQKMEFMQYKNKRLLKFIYECSGCERYEEMLVEIFRIFREGFAEIRLKIVPELREKSKNDIEPSLMRI